MCSFFLLRNHSKLLINGFLLCTLNDTTIIEFQTKTISDNISPQHKNPTQIYYIVLFYILKRSVNEGRRKYVNTPPSWFLHVIVGIIILVLIVLVKRLII